MGNISGKIALTALEHAIIKGKNGEELLVIPIKKNNLFKSEKGNVYLDLQGFELDAKGRGDRKDTHIVHQSLGKEKITELKAAGKYPPTLGNFTAWDSVGHTEQAPAASGEIAQQVADDLPF